MKKLSQRSFLLSPFSFLLFPFSFFLLLPSASFSQSAVNWGDPVTVAPGTFGNQHPHIAVDSAGSPLIIWGNAGSNKTYFSRRNPDSLAFSTPLQLNPASIPVFAASWAGPDLAAHGDTVYAVFKQTPEHTGSIYLVRSYDGGATFSDPVQVDDLNGDLSRFPSVTTDAAGHPLVAFMRFDAGFSNARYVVARSTDFGNTFGPDVLASEYSGGDVCDCCPASIVSSGNVVATLYRDNLNNLRNSWAGISTDGGATFPNGIQIDHNNWTINACPSTGPDGVIIGDSLYSVFMSGAGGVSRVYLSISSLSTGQAGPDIHLTGLVNGISTQNYPRIARSGPSLAIVLKQTVNNVPQAGMFFKSDINSSDPMEYYAISANDVANIDVAMTNGRIQVVWEDVTSGTVQYMKGYYTSPLCNNVSNAGTICCDQQVCPNDTVATILEASPPLGGTGALEYMWIQLTENDPSGLVWKGVPGAFGPTLLPALDSGTHYFMREVRRENCTNLLTSNIVTITFTEDDPGCTELSSSEPGSSMPPVSISPNPFHDNFVVSNTSTRAAEVQIVHLAGHFRSALSVNGGESKPVDTGEWPAGLYAIKTRTEDGKAYTSKLLKI